MHQRAYQDDSITPKPWDCTCSVEDAVAWLDVLCEEALEPDSNVRALQLVARAVDHLLAVEGMRGVR